MSEDFTKDLLEQDSLSVEEICSRYSLIMHAEKTGNISESCRILGFSRRSYYKWLERYKKNGFKGLTSKDSSNSKSNILAKAEDLIVEMSLSLPRFGSSRLSEKCKAEGVNISAASVQKILNKNAIGSIRERAKALGLGLIKDKQRLPREIVEFLESYDERFQDRTLLSKSGRTFAQGGKRIGETSCGKPIYIQAVIHLESQYVFCHIFKGDQQFDASFLLKSKVMPYIFLFKSNIERLFTRHNKMYSDQDGHYQKTILTLGIDHKTLKERNIASLSKFFTVVKSEFLPQYDLPSMSISELQNSMNEWSEKYNDQSIPLYPNYGQSPKQKWHDLHGDHNS